MKGRNDPEPVGERNWRILISSAQTPAAPPLSAALSASLAARVRGGAGAGSRLPVAAAGCAVAGLALLVLLPFLPAGRMDLRWWMAAVPAANLLLGPFAAAVVILKMKREASDAKT
ncbi:MAG: hypothetical protein WBM17_14750 [Anaerolineales bacterium]